ncbi:hypothetical protein LCGC14_1259840, partial [marine sediment metagenome]
NALSILHKCGLTNVARIEKSYRIIGHKPAFDPMTEEAYPKPLESFNVNVEPEPVYSVKIEDIPRFNSIYNLGWDQDDIQFYSSLFTERDPTNVELIDIAQSNSEHSRHNFFSGTHIIDGRQKAETLFQLIKKTLLPNTNSKLAFCDNASAINGYNVQEIVPSNVGVSSIYIRRETIYHPTFTAETHNFPTGIAPFPGAATGVGGRIRDTIAIGRGGKITAGTAGYCVASQELLIQASNGASDYGNKIGEPIIQGFTRFFDQYIGDVRWAWIKPIMFSGGVGIVADRDLKKGTPEEGLAIVRIGGPAYRIGVGGSTASSQHQNQQHQNLSAVQRGDPEMGNRVCNVIRALTEDDRNPIISIHDQGAGGTANVTKEIVYPIGGIVDIRNITTGDPTLTTVEKWIAEYQEQVTTLIHPRDLPRVWEVATRENVDAVVFGYTSMDGLIRVRDDSGEPVNLDLTKIFKPPKKTYTDRHIVRVCLPPVLPNVDFEHALYDVFRLESVGSKRFLTNKVDRSVTGLIVQQQCVGPLHTPISDYAMVAHSYFSDTGTATSIGEQPLKSFIDPRRSGQLAVIEMLTNLMWVKISNLKDIKCSVNWMWPAKLPGENAAIYDCMQGLSDYMTALGISADGGKDSVSMYTRQNESTIIKSPRSVVVSAYVTVPDIHVCITTELKGNSVLLHIPTDIRDSLGGSALFQAFKHEGGEINVTPAVYLKKIFMCIQQCISKQLITAGHDISDGGLITCILEMAIAGDLGMTIETKTTSEAMSYYFSETPGVVIEVPKEKIVTVKRYLTKIDIGYVILGETRANRRVIIRNNSECLIDRSIGELRGWWEQTSQEYEATQTSAVHATAEWEFLTKKTFPRWIPVCTQIANETQQIGNQPRVAVLRDEGSNGSREMAAAFSSAGFEVWDITMTDLLTEPRLLDRFRGLAFVGGFTYADVFGAGTGWAAQIKHHPGIAQAFTRFKEREDTFSFGVCNGCQLMSQLGWVPSCKFKKNLSKRFESRLSTVRMTENSSIMLKGLDMTTFGVWVAHTEGRFVGKVPTKCIVMQYIDYNYKPTEEYPLNPSGSANGICGICSPDGRHLAMMPHPERCWLTWQMPWVPEWWQEKYTPWFKMFVNAYEWCKQ